MNNKLKKIIKQSFLFNIIYSYRQRKSFQRWKKKGIAIPLHPTLKQKVIKEYAKKNKVDTLIETGTYLGDMIWSTRNNFKKIYSIELSEELYKKAVEKFKKFKHIKIINGDSGEMLPGILEKIETPCLFWLDGHYSCGFTAKGNLNTPIYKELDAIFNHKIKNHVILIDDARCFIGKDDYPTIQELKDYVGKHNNNLKIEINDDIIRIQ